MTLTNMAARKIALPPLPEQRAIASFLDRETAEIDTLVAKKERLIELLQEKRAALIARAVTKGLDPIVPMKDSGVEWLGEIPARWTVRRLGWLLMDRPRNGLSPPIGPDGNVPTFSTAAVKDGVVQLVGNLKYTNVDPLAARTFIVKLGDIFLLRGSGSRNLVGRAGALADEPPEGCIYPDILIRVRPAAAVAPWFLVNCLNSTSIRPQVESAAETASGIWKVSAEDVRGIRLPLPPLREQIEIEAKVSRATTRIDATVSRVREGIDRLREYRTALISAAVTGKIDVREEAA